MEIKIQNEEVIKMAKEALPKLLKEVFEKTYSNPLKDAMDKVLQDDSFKVELRQLIVDCYKEASKEIDFKLFVKEAVVQSVIKQLQK